MTINKTTGAYSLAGESWSSETEVFNMNASYGNQFIYNIYTISKAKQGPRGLTGDRGDTGPGLIFRGIYSSSKTYIYDAIRRDVVSYNGAYYTVKNEGTITGTWNYS